MKNEVILNLRRIRTANRKIVKDALMKGGETFQEEAAARAPVASGDLRESIETQLTANKNSEIVVSVGPTVFYGAFQEFGTSKQSAKPFMRPAFDAKGEAVLDQVSREVFGDIAKTVRP